MRDLTLNKWLMVALVLLMPSAANAAGLGKLTVVSALGQPFHAEIDMVSVSREELASLTAQLASADAYREANLQYVGATAALRLTVEKRADGRPYIRITSTRAINEPFLDLLIELNWSSGRLVREYTALLDPPGFGTSPLPAAPVAAPEVRPAPVAPAPVAPVPVAPAPVAAAPVAPAPVTPPAPAVSRPAPAETYGPIQRGETMNKIAGELRPDGVTHEQMLMALFRSNPDAFIRKNVNLVMAGKILRVPDKAEVAAIPHPEAIKEFRAQVVEWNSFRQRVAEAAGREPDARTTAGGKITTRVDDAAADAPKDVVRLSKGEPPGVAAGAGDKRRSVAERVRTLEEEVVTREKALAEANERIVQLEMTIKDMQRLVEIKSPTMAAAQKQAAAKVEPAPKPKPAAPPEKTAMAPTQPAPMAEPPKPKPRVVPPPPLPGYDDLMNTVMDNLPLIAGGSVVLLGGLYFGLARRRRSRAPGWDKPNGVAPTLDDAAWSSPGDETMAGEPPAARSSGDDVDPLAEAEVYVAYGRDAQAEEILKEAMAKEPSRPDIQVKLLEIYAARKDKSAFSRVAQSLSRVTGGQGNDWHKVAAIGYTLDPGNPLFASGRGAAASMPPGGPTSSDFNVNLGTTSRDGKPADVVTFDEYADSDAQKQPMVEPTIRRAGHKSEAPASREPDIAIDQPQAGAMTTDIAFDVPETGRATVADIALDSEDAEKRKSGGHDIDFNLELPKIDEVPTQPVAADAPGTDQRGGDRESDFKLDLGDINLNLDDRGHAFGQDSAGADRDKDTQWYDVQTKFDLAKAYQEMGDKDGAKEILLEVIREGDPEQKVAAKNLLETLA